jgi:hypothetical protein
MKKLSVYCLSPGSFLGSTLPHSCFDPLLPRKLPVTQSIVANHIHAKQVVHVLSKRAVSGWAPVAGPGRCDIEITFPGVICPPDEAFSTLLEPGRSIATATRA